MAIKTVFFDWDFTLAEEMTTNLYEGAEELLKNLINNNIKVRIITGRPSFDPTPGIHAALLEKGINLKPEDVIWAGAPVYLGHEATGATKADLMEKYREVNNSDPKNDHLEPEEILFVDDRKQYIDAAAKKGFQTKLVPIDVSGLEYFDERELLPIRKQFFKDIQNLLCTPVNSNTTEATNKIPAATKEEEITVAKDIDVGTELDQQLRELRHLIHGDEASSQSEALRKKLIQGEISDEEFISQTQHETLPAVQVDKNESTEFNTALVLQEIAKQPIWDDKGITHLFWHKKPDGIKELSNAKADLSIFIDIAKSKAMGYQNSMYDALGIRATITREFYSLIQSLEYVPNDKQFAAVKSFCDKWKFNVDLNMNFNTAPKLRS